MSLAAPSPDSPRHWYTSPNQSYGTPPIPAGIKKDVQLTETLPERRYDVVGQLLAGAIDNAIADGTTVTDALTAAAASWGRTIADQALASRRRTSTKTEAAAGRQLPSPH